MQIYFIRHGEATDDVEDRYGGWYDPELSPKGKHQAEELAEKLASQGIRVDLILSSPFKRTKQTAEIIGKHLNLDLQTSVYLKERNTYGLLCGENKTEAKEKYPDMVDAYENKRPVIGQESYEDFLSRVKLSVEKLGKLNYETIICVTHGKYLDALFKDILAKEAKKFNDCCFACVELVEGKLTYLSSEGIDC